MCENEIVKRQTASVSPEAHELIGVQNHVNVGREMSICNAIVEVLPSGDHTVLRAAAPVRVANYVTTLRLPSLGI